MSSSKAAKRRRRLERQKRIKASTPEVDGPLKFQATATFDAASLEAKEGEPSVPRFSLQAYNGGKMRPSGFRFPVVVELAGVRHDDNVPVFLDHDTSGRNIVGHSSVTVDKSIVADGIVSGDTDVAKTVVSSAKKGFPWQVSIGASVEDKKFVKSGESVVVNGKSHSGPFYHVVKSHLHEVSFVPIGADRTTSAAIAAKERSQKMAEETVKQGDEHTNELLEGKDAKLIEWIEAQGFDPNELDEQQLLTLELSYKVLKDKAVDDAIKASPTDMIDQMRADAAKEVTRMEEIHKLTKNDAEIRAKAIGEGWTIQKTELELLRKVLSVAPASVTPGTRTDFNQKTIECALCLQDGLEASWLDKEDKHWNETQSGQRGFDEQTIDAATDLGSYTFTRLFHEYLYANNISVAPGLSTVELISKVKDAHKKIRASQGFSTISLPGILSNVMEKRMLAMFESVRPVAQRLSSSRSVPDFKESKAFRLTGNGDFLPLGPTGELQDMSLQEEEYPNKPTTRGRMISVSREMLINDDMGALTGITRILGRKAALSLQKEFFTLWVSLEGSGFFAAGNNNLINDPLAIDGLTTAEKTYYDQVDADGDPIDVEAQTLLVPSALKVTAEELMDSTTSMVWDRDTAATATNRWPTTNPHVGKWNIEWSPWLNKLGEADQDTAWWLLAPANVLAAMEIVYLRGRTTPVIESEDAEFSTLGFQWRSYFDFGIAQQDYRAAVKSSGTGA